MIGIVPKTFIDKTPHLMMGPLWQIIRIWVSQSINLKSTPELARLLQDGEELSDLLKLSPEQILIRWVNWHLAKAGDERRIANLGKDVSDSYALFKVLNNIDKSKCSLDGIDNEDLNARA